MPGTNKDTRPEMKYYDPFDPTAVEGVLAPFVIYNTVNHSTNFEVAGSDSWVPVPLNPPIQGVLENQRIGKEYLFRYLKLKGFIEVHRNCVSNINWRLVLIRWSSLAPDQFDRARYISMFYPADPDGPITVATAKSYCETNYYCKIKNPDHRNVFKRKVIASGQVPKTYDNYRTWDRYYPPEVDPNDFKGHSATSVKSVDNKAMYFPIDVSVTLNDNVDPTAVRYYLLLEVDDGNGIDADAWLDDTNLSADEEIRDLDWPNCQFELKFYSKAYFQDY